MPDADDLQVLEERWGKASSAKKWNLALEISVDAYRMAREAKDYVRIIMFLGFIRIASQRLFEEQSRKKNTKAGAFACSFCTKSGKDLKIVLGLYDVAICADCARLASEKLNTR